MSDLPAPTRSRRRSRSLLRQRGAESTHAGGTLRGVTGQRRVRMSLCWKLTNRTDPFAPPAPLTNDPCRCHPPKRGTGARHTPPLLAGDHFRESVVEVSAACNPQAQTADSTDTTGRRRRFVSAVPSGDEISQVVDDQRTRVPCRRMRRLPVSDGKSVNANGSGGRECRLLLGAQTRRELIGVSDESRSRTTHERAGIAATGRLQSATRR